MRDRELVERVKDATDLVALIGATVVLRKQGGAWVGKCPFHGERSASFNVIPEKRFYHCFGCGKNGDAFAWLQEREGMTFPEALEVLAKHAGIALPEKRERSRSEMDQEERIRQALDMAEDWFSQRLGHNTAAKAYLEDERRLTPEFVTASRIGFAPDEWEGLVSHLRNAGVALESMEQAGIVSRSERGNLIDFMRNRIIIPIRDGRGRLVAFGGRAMGDAKPKYLNTRDTPLFSKGSTLFGFHLAKGVMRDGAVVVEGYFDVLQLQQQGVREAVAPLGTALTEEHLKLLLRHTKRLTLCFDGDAAGLRATEKSLKLAIPMGFDVRLLILPEGEDPDTLCIRMGGEAFREMVKAAPDWTSFTMERATAGRNLGRVADRMDALRDMLELLPYLQRGFDRTGLIGTISHSLQIPVFEIERAIEGRRREQAEQQRVEQQKAVPVPAPALAKPAAAGAPPKVDAPLSDDPMDDPSWWPDEDPLAGIDEGAEIVMAAPRLEELDPQINQLIRLACDAETLPSVVGVPGSWWEYLAGAGVLQAVLDAGGKVDDLPQELLSLVRVVVAKGAGRQESGLDVGGVLRSLERAFVQREIDTLNRQLGQASVQASPELQRRVEAALADLLRRKGALARGKR